VRELGGALAAGDKDIGHLAASFGVGALTGFISRTGFLGAAHLAMNSAYGGGSGFLLYGAAMLADSIVYSTSRMALDDTQPFEMTFFLYTVSHQPDGRWTRRWSFAQSYRLITGAIMADQGMGDSFLCDFTPQHRDRLYQAISKKLEYANWLVYSVGGIGEDIYAAWDGDILLSGLRSLSGRDVTAIVINIVIWGLPTAYGLGYTLFEERELGCGNGKWSMDYMRSECGL
jgi:hypothetical protein